MKEQVNIRADEARKTLKATLLCELDHHAAREIREQIDEATRTFLPDLLVLDFSQVAFMDSSGVGLILGRLALCERYGANLALTGLSPALLRLLRMAGIEKMPHLFIDAASASEKEGDEKERIGIR